MDGKGTPKNEQNQFCHSPSVKAMTPSEVERQDSHMCCWREVQLARLITVAHAGRQDGMPRVSCLGVGGGLNHLGEVEVRRI